MRWPIRHRSLLAQFGLRVIAPMTVVMTIMLVAGSIIYQRAVASLLIDRDHQLAVLVATQMSEAVSGYARVLETLAGDPDMRSDSPERRVAALEHATDSLQIFSGGAVLVDSSGKVLAAGPDDVAPVGATVAGEDYFMGLKAERQPAFSNVLLNRQTGQPVIVIGVPVLDERDTFSGALLGVINLDNTRLSTAIEALRIGDGGIAYLVDGTGRVIFHPARENIGLDFTDRPYVANVVVGESGGTLWRAPTGEQLVLGYTPVSHTGWGLIVREPWESVVAPVQAYGIGVALAALVTVGVVAYLLWQGVGQIAGPVRLLADQTVQLAAGNTLEPVANHGIDEIDALARAFNQMATQIAAYRAGLRRYVGAITQSQEDERRRIARELHDDTVQSLLTMARRLELIQASEQDAQQGTRLAELQAAVAETMRGVRDISRDLRPLILEDLGLIPALQALVRIARQGEGAVPHAKFDLTGQPVTLRVEQELALYRITQEALTNVRKHARPTGVQVSLIFEAARVCLEIKDDGLGFDVPESFTQLAQHGNYGLLGIQERVWDAGGTLAIHSTIGQGTRLIITIPLNSN